MKNIVLALGMLIPSSVLPLSRKDSSAQAALWQTFKHVQEIRGPVAKMALAQAQRRSFWNLFTKKIDITVDEDVNPNNGYVGSAQDQTKRGLYLLAGEFPQKLMTPWGLFPLYIMPDEQRYTIDPVKGRVLREVPSDHVGRSMFSEFKKLIALRFVENTCEGKIDTSPLGHVSIIRPDGSQKEISETELDQYKGTDTQVVAHLYGCECYSLYAIDAVRGVKTESPTKRRVHPYGGYLQGDYGEAGPSAHELYQQLNAFWAKYKETEQNR